MFHISAKILYNKRVKQNYFKIGLNARQIAGMALPGQFVTLRITEGSEPLLRRPFSIHKIRQRAKGRGQRVEDIEILYEVIGRATEILSQKKAGEYLDIIGPLGKGFDYTSRVSPPASHVLVTGGMGVAPLVFLAEKLMERKTQNAKRKTMVLIGAKTKSQILCERELRVLGCEVKIATDDGSKGSKGKVTELLRKILAARCTLHVARQDKEGCNRCYVIPETIIYACGPRPMLEEVSRLSKKYQISAQISLEEHMACGIGACLGCVVKTRQGLERVCKEGPVFEAERIIWPHVEHKVL